MLMYTHIARMVKDRLRLVARPCITVWIQVCVVLLSRAEKGRIYGDVYADLFPKAVGKAGICGGTGNAKILYKEPKVLCMMTRFGTCYPDMFLGCPPSLRKQG